MVKRTAQTFSLILMITLISLVAFSVAGAGDNIEGSGHNDKGVVMHHFHALFEKLHGLHGGHHHGGAHHGAEMSHHMAHAAQLVEELDLTEAQHAHFEEVHEILGGSHRSMAELHQQLLAELEDGYLETDSVRRIVDQHVEGMRTLAYGLSDELIALINGLDAEQRETLMAHLEEAKSVL